MVADFFPLQFLSTGIIFNVSNPMSLLKISLNMEGSWHSLWVEATTKKKKKRNKISLCLELTNLEAREWTLQLK